jgi:enediyne biosynthesis protein E7
LLGLYRGVQRGIRQIQAKQIALGAGSPKRLDPAGRRLPQLRLWPLLKILLKARRDRLGLLVELGAESSGIIRLRIPGRTIVLVTRPDLIQQVLVDKWDRYSKGIGLQQARDVFGRGLLTSSGTEWERRRISSGGLFSAASQHTLAAATQDAVESLQRRWDFRAFGGEPFDVAYDLSSAVLTVLGRTVFGVDLSMQSSRLVPCLRFLSRWCVDLIDPILPRRLFGYKQYRRYAGDLNQLTEDIVRQEALPGYSTAHRPDLQNSAQGAMLNRLDKGEIRSMLLAGHETTTSALAWTLYLMAKHSDVVRQHGMECCENLMMESLRLYPPVWLLPREATSDDVLGGYQIPEGVSVLISPYVLHRDPRLWPEPQRFRLDRFRKWGTLDDGYIPFGIGPFSCIGRHIAVTVLRSVIRLCLERYVIRLASDDPSPVAALTLQMDKPLRVTLECLGS